MTVKVIVLVLNFSEALIQSSLLSQQITNVRLGFVGFIFDGLNGFVDIGIFPSLSLHLFSGQCNLASDSFFFHFQQFVCGTKLLTFDLTLSHIIFSSAVVLDKLLRFSLSVFQLLASNLGFFVQMVKLDFKFQTVFGSQFESFEIADFGELLS